MNHTNDTEEIHSPCSAESFDGYDTEVVPDSDDDTSEPIFSKQSSHRLACVSKRFARDLDKVESQCEKLEISNIGTRVFDNEGHVSSENGHIINFQENDGCPTTLYCSMKASRLNVSDREMPKAVDPCLAKNIDNSDKLDDEITIDDCDGISKPKRRDVNVSIVYTRRRKSCNLVEDEKRSPKKTNEDARLSYVESQEPEDVSNALLFVDQYVVSNSVLSSPVPDLSVKDKSLFSQSANLACHLIRSTHRRNREEIKHIFEWDDRHDDIRPSDASSKKVNRTYIRRFSSMRDMVSKDKTEPSDLTQKVEDSTKDVYKCTNAQVTEPMYEKDLEKSEVPHQQVSERSNVEDGKDYRELEYAFDVGVDTQMAAEAIHALAYATSIDCSDVEVDKCEHNQLNKSFKGSQKSINAGNFSFPRRRRSASKGAVSGSEDSGDRLKSKLASYSTRLDFMRKRCENEANFKMDGSKENLGPHVSILHSSRDKIKRRKKISGIYPVAGNLKVLNVFSTTEGPTTESIDAKTDVVQVDSCDRWKRMSIVNTLDKSYQIKNCSKPFNDKCLNTNDAMVSKEDLICQAVDYTGIHKSVDEKVSKPTCQKVNDARKTGNGQQKTSSVRGRPADWYCRDYPKGKRCKIMLGPNGSSSSAKVGGNRNSHRLSGQLILKGVLGPCFTDFNIITKRRSSTYISPCLLFQKKSEKRLVTHDDHELSEIGIVYDNGSGPKNTSYSEKMIGSSNDLQPGKTDNKSCVSTMDDPTLGLNKNASSGDARTPSKLIYKCNQNHAKKTSTPFVKRELVRLGFREFMPEVTLSDSRKRKTMANVRILLSKHLDERLQKQLKKILVRFGVSMVSCPSNATHFVADKFARTRNMLEFVAQGKPVVTHMWLESCQQAGFYIDETSFILRDMQKEQELGFRLSVSLDRARKHPLLKGYKVIITPNTKPGLEMLTALVKAVHGQVVDLLSDHLIIEKMDLNYLLILSCEEDRAHCLPFLERGKPAYSSELLLNGIIVQKLEFERHRLFMEA